MKRQERYAYTLQEVQIILSLLPELLMRKEPYQLGKNGAPSAHPVSSLLRTMPPSTRLPSFQGSNRFSSETDVSHSIYVACAFIAKVSPDTLGYKY